MSEPNIKAHNKYIPGSGPSVSPLMVIMEGPGETEFEKGEVLVGPTGRLLDSLMITAGLSLSQCYKTNVEKYYPPGGKIINLKLIGKKPYEELDDLKAECAAIKPNAILVGGNHALKAVTGKTGINKWRGSILKSKFGNYKVIPILHPTNFLPPRRGEKRETVKYSMKWVTIADIKRAIEESLTPEWNLPRRSLEVCRSYNQLVQFLDSTYGRGKRRVSVDIETFKCVPMCIGLAFSPFHGLSIPLLLMDNLPIKSREELIQIWRLLAKLFDDPTLEIVGQNWKFDNQKLIAPLNLLGGVKVWYDCAVAQHVLYPEFPKSLEFQCSTWTREPYYKDELKEHDPRKDSIEDVLLYNAKDVCVPFEIHEKQLAELDERGLTKLFFELYMPMHKLYMDVESHGTLIDEEKRLYLYREFDRRDKETNAELNRMVGYEVNINSPKQVAELLFVGLKLPHREKVDEEAIINLISNHCDDDSDNEEILKSILALRKIKRTKTVLSAKPDYDGRMRTSISFCGTETSRSTNKIPQQPLRPHKLGWGFQTLTKHGDIGHEIRSLCIPEPGKLIGNCDLKQAEPRIVAHLANDEYLKSCFARGIDVHRITAGWFFIGTDRTEEELLAQIGESDTKDPRRFIGKTGRNGGNYDEGYMRLTTSINTDAYKYHIDVVVHPGEVKRMLKVFHEKSPNIKQVFHREVREAALASKKYLLTGPFGNQRQFYGRRDERLWKEMYAHLPQSAVPLHVKSAMIRVKARLPHLPIWLESHDAFSWREDKVVFNESAEIIKEEMERAIDFSQCSLPREPLIIPCDVEVGENYKELKKWKGN